MPPPRFITPLLLLLRYAQQRVLYALRGVAAPPLSTLCAMLMPRYAAASFDYALLRH